ncbi:MAG: DNA-methyltransferase [Pseudobdellovibrio sp.]
MNQKKLKKLNQIELGDCLEVIKQIKDESVDLVYLDPPFFTQKNHVLQNKSGDEQFCFEDKWEDINEYISYLSTRLRECRRVLKPTGSLFLQCDKTASHYIKVALDKIFGFDNFQSEIIWTYRRWSNSKKGLLNNHQTIYFYGKTSDFKFNKVFEDYSPTTNIEQIVQLRKRDERNKSVYRTDEQGHPILASKKNGVPMGDVWEIPFLNPKAKERVSYPTQKPVLLLEKIIRLVTDEGDLVLDPFCGSGTTPVAAKLLKRNFIGIDCNPSAVKIAKQRLENPFKTESRLLTKGKSSYLRQNDETRAQIKKIGGVVVQRNKGIDGLISTQNQIIPVKVVLQNQEIESDAVSLKKASMKNKYKLKALFLQKKITSQTVREIENKYNVLVFNSLGELNKKIKSL